MAEEKKPAQAEKAKAEKTEKKADATTGKKIKLDKTVIMIAGAVAAVLVVVMAILAFTMGKPTEESGDKNSDKDGNSQVDSDKKDDKDEKVTLDKTLSTSGLSMKYPGKGWKLENSKIEGADSVASISKGNDSSVLLTAVESEAGLTTKQFAESSMSSYKTSGFTTVQALTAVKINGKEWYKARLYGQGAYATVMFAAEGNDYYIVTFADMNKEESAEVKQMIETLTIK